MRAYFAEQSAPPSLLWEAAAAAAPAKRTMRPPLYHISAPFVGYLVGSRTPKLNLVPHKQTNKKVYIHQPSRINGSCRSLSGRRRRYVQRAQSSIYYYFRHLTKVNYSRCWCCCCRAPFCLHAALIGLPIFIFAFYFSFGFVPLSEHGCARQYIYPLLIVIGF